MINRDKIITAEEKIIQGLESFANDLESGADLTKKYTCRKRSGDETEKHPLIAKNCGKIGSDRANTD